MKIEAKIVRGTEGGFVLYVQLEQDRKDDPTPQSLRCVKVNTPCPFCTSAAERNEVELTEWGEGLPGKLSVEVPSFEAGERLLECLKKQLALRLAEYRAQEDSWAADKTFVSNEL